MTILSSLLWHLRNLRATLMTPADETALARESWDFWIGKGCSPAQAAAWLAMEDGESSFDFRARGDGDKAFGSFQDHTDRVAEIKRGCGADIVNGGHMDQLRGAYYEATQGWYRRVWPLLMATTTIADAVTLLVVHFEQSAQPTRDIARRSGFAEKWLGVF